MKLSATLLVASSALFSAVLALNPIDLLNGVAPGNSVAEPFSWPGDAAAFRLRRQGGPSNSERMQRGLTPSRPRKLYQAKVDSDLAKRIANPAAQASGVINRYTFQACYAFVSTGNGFTVYSLAYTDAQDLANKCAARQDGVNINSPGSFSSFFIADRPTSNCYVSVTGNPQGQTACASGPGEGAVYTLASP